MKRFIEITARQARDILMVYEPETSALLVAMYNNASEIIVADRGRWYYLY